MSDTDIGILIFAIWSIICAIVIIVWIFVKPEDEYRSENEDWYSEELYFMSKTHIPINGRYPIIAIEHFGQTMRDLNLTDCDVICWNPSWPIDCKKIDVKPDPFNGKMALCNLTVMNPDNARHMMCNILESLSSLAIFTRVDKPLFICSRYVATVLGLDEDGDIVYIREVGE